MADLSALQNNALFSQQGGMVSLNGNSPLFSNLNQTVGNTNFNVPNIQQTQGINGTSLYDGMMKGLNSYGMSRNKGNILSSLQNTQSSGNPIFDKVGQAVDGTVNALQMINDIKHKDDPRYTQSMQEKIGYAEGGHLFDAGGYAQAASTAVGLAANAAQQASLDVNPIEANKGINSYGYRLGANNQFEDLDSLLNTYNSMGSLNHVNKRDLRHNSYFEDVLNGISAGNQGAQAGFNVGGGVGAVVGGILGTGSSVIGSLIGRHKAGKTADWLNQRSDTAMARLENDKNNQVGNILENQYIRMLQNENNSAFGGPLHSYGSDWDNGIITIDAGGTHEENPYDGVQIGVDPEGTPNLVEEGEVIYNDYVFSNRLKVDKKFKEKYKLKGDDLTYADAAKKFQEETEERPNDPIAKRTLDVFMSALTESQETLKAKREERKQAKAMKDAMISDAIANVLNPPMEEGIPQEEIPQEGIPQEGIMPEEAMGQPPVMQEELGAPEGYALGGNLFDGETGSSFIAKPYSWYRDNYFQAYPYLTNSNALQQDFKLTTPPIDYSLSTKNGLYSNYKDNNLFYNNALLGSDSYSSKKTKTKKDKTNKGTTSKGIDETKLRYAPAIGSAVGLLHDIFNKPDYSSVNTMMDSAASIPNVSFKPLGDYMTYSPLDKSYYTNQLLASAAGSRRLLSNNSGGNRGIAAAQILASDYTTGNQLGALARQAEEYNAAQREKVATFNRTTNQVNSEGLFKAGATNADIAKTRAGIVAQALQMKDTIDGRLATSKSANMSNLFDNLGNIGIDSYNRRERDNLIRSGVFGTMPAWWEGLSPEVQAQTMQNGLKMQKEFDAKKAGSKKHGGKLKKKSLTY